jgi:hypothetical protein
MRVRWDETAKRQILTAVENLQGQGMRTPPKRAVIYILTDWSKRGKTGANVWSKDAYDALTRYIAKWRREVGGGLVLFPFGMFSEEAGQNYFPYSMDRKVRDRDAIARAPLVRLDPEGTLFAVYVEHAALVPSVSEWLDGVIPVISSQGQIREEAFHGMLQNLMSLSAEIGARHIRILGLVDYDKGGDDIHGAHDLFAYRYFGYDIERFAVTREQVIELGLDPVEKWQIDGVVGLDPVGFRARLRKAVGLPDDGASHEAR